MMLSAPMSMLIFARIAAVCLIQIQLAAVRNSVPTNAECSGITDIRIKRDGRIQVELLFALCVKKNLWRHESMEH